MRGANGSREWAPDDKLRDEAIQPAFWRWVAFSCLVLYDMHHTIADGGHHDRAGRITDVSSFAATDILDHSGNRRARGVSGHRNARHQYPAAVAAGDGRFAESVECCRHLRDHGVSRGIRARPARGRAALGSLWPALAGTIRLCGVPGG